jgi:hypothetical protein
MISLSINELKITFDKAHGTITLWAVEGVNGFFATKPIAEHVSDAMGGRVYSVVFFTTGD